MRCAVLFLAAILIAMAIVPVPASSQAEDEQILRVAVQGGLVSSNPFYDGLDHWTYLMTRWLYDTPVFSDAEGNIVPYIAIGSANSTGVGTDWSYCEIGNFGYSPESLWQNSSQKEAIIFYDFENVLWHDGTQMDIRDVLFSYHVAAQHSLSWGDVQCLMSEDYHDTHKLGIEKLWESGTRAALKFTLHTPYWQFFNHTLAVRLLPEHVWTSLASGQNVDGAKIWCDAGYDKDLVDSWKISLAQRYENPRPVGNGIFKWKDFNSLGYMNITTWHSHFFKGGYKYENYCVDEYEDTLAAQPYIDGISFKIFLTSESAIQAMKNNEIDYIAWNLPVTYIQELCNSPGISLYQSPQQGFTYLAYNMRKTSFGYLNGDPANGDAGKALRRAIAHVIDKNTITQRLLFGLGIAGEGPVSCFSPWYNSSIPKYSYDPEEAKNILANAGYKVNQTGTLLSGAEAIAAAGNGNWWVRPDGQPIGSSSGGMISVYSPPTSYDPIRAQTTLMIVREMNSIGLYAESAYDWSYGLEVIEQRAFDIYVYKSEIDTDPTCFLYDLFRSENTPDGQNYPGYQNSTAYAAYMGYAESFDEIIELARSTDNETTRKQAVFEAQASLCYDLPYDVLHYRTNVEALRSDRFTGWRADYGCGSIFNPRSIRAITGPNPYKLTAQFISPPSAMLSNSTTPITVLVKDQDGNPIESAQVWLETSVGSLSTAIGNTSSNGKLTVTFTAPWADPNEPETVANGTQAIIQIKEAKYTNSTGWKYDDAPSRVTLIKVFPEDVPFLSVSISADPDIISPDISEDGTLGFTYVDVIVTDQDGNAVQSASVALTVSPAVPTIELIEQETDADGKARFKVTATDMPDNDGSTIEYVLKAIAMHLTNNSIQGENQCNLWIVDAAPPEEPPPSRMSLSPTEITMTVAAIFVVAAVFAYYLRRRKKK